MEPNKATGTINVTSYYSDCITCYVILLKER